MSGWRLALKAVPSLRVDLRGVTPIALAAFSATEVAHLPVGHGRALQPLGEFFHCTPHGEDGTLLFEGDLTRFDRVGWQMDGGILHVEGPLGHYAGAALRAGEMRVRGSAGLLAACEMAGGTLVVEGDVGDFAASTQPGSMDGMRGGSFVVTGNAGARFGDRMRRGTALVHGDAGDFLAARLVAGTIAVGGAVGAHAGWGMRRGSLVLAGAPFAGGPTFVPGHGEVQVAWQLLARELARQGGPFAGIAGRRFARHRGDLAAAGQGEIFSVV